MATPDLVALVKVAGKPVPVDIAARALGATAEDIMALGAQLVAAGELVESTAGYSAAAGTDHEPSPAVRAFMASHLADALT